MWINQPEQKPDHRRESLPTGWACAKERFCNTARPGRAFKGLGGAKRYCRKDSIGDNFAQGAIIKYWVFTQGGAWRNLKLTGTAPIFVSNAAWTRPTKTTEPSSAKHGRHSH